MGQPSQTKRGEHEADPCGRVKAVKATFWHESAIV